MKIGSFFGFKAKHQVGMHSVYGLTPLGKRKAELSLSGPQWEVLTYLNENGSSSVSEISGEIKASPEKVRAILRNLLQSGYVRKESQED